MTRISKTELAKLTWEALCQAFPDSACSLDYDEPYKLAIRGILSAQCTDVRVNITSAELFGIYDSIDRINEASEEDIGRIIKPCGLYKSKAKSIKAFAALLAGEWGYEIPRDTTELMRVPGIGRKIANLIVGEIYQIPAIVVDTHCKRVMKRIGITKSDTPVNVERDMMKVFKKEQWIAIGHLSVDLGRAYCTARAPKCDTCPLNTFCKRSI
ncbi:MAG: endonuclease III [Saccharofermentans sp.]|nr:endonuclease III [Saccharofermentans sp.]